MSVPTDLNEFEARDVRLVASDVDGTLLRGISPIDERLREAIARVIDAGIEFVPVTGRPIRWLEPLREQLPNVSTVICANGAVVYDMVNEEVIAAHAISTADAALAFSTLRREIPGVRLAMETLDGHVREPDYSGDAQPGATVLPLEKALESNPVIVKLLIRVPDHGNDQLLALVAPILAEICRPTHSNGSGGLVEASARGMSKSVTLAMYCAERGITASQVIAFGDMPNDEDMLTWAGRGYAMADGHPALLAATAHRAPRIESGGVAHVLETLIYPDNYSI